MARKSFSEDEIELMNKISINLKRVLKMRGVTQTQLADNTEIATSTISDYYNAKTLMSQGNLRKISKSLNVSTVEIWPPSNSDYVFYKDIPLLGTVCAGDGLLAEQNVDEYIHYPFKGKRQPDYALHVKGNSMVGVGIENGDIVFMGYAQRADYSGQIVAVIINDHQDGTLKRIKWTEGSDKVKLIPENDLFETIECDFNQIQICGVYMGCFKPFKEV